MPRAVPRTHKQCRNVKARWKSFCTYTLGPKHLFLDNQIHHRFINKTFRFNHHYSKTILIQPIHIYPSFRLNNEISNRSSPITNHRSPPPSQSKHSSISATPNRIPPTNSYQLPSTTLTMCRARITTYLLCGCIQKHQDLCIPARRASTAAEWDHMHVCSDWDNKATEVHEKVGKRCLSHARELMEREGRASGR
jgi:hypothetical protein